jgi:DNA-directed RNA polymerase subunit RPC12/RpoP
MSLTDIIQLLQRLEALIIIAAAIVVVLTIAVALRKRRGNGKRLSVSEKELDSIKVVSGLEEAVKEEPAPPEEHAEGLSDEEISKLETRVIESLMIRGALRPLPIPGSKEGGHYPELAGVSEKDAQRVIRGLIEKGLVIEAEREFSAVACPICGSCIQVAFISCKNCGSFRIEEMRYYRHICGYIGPESSFKTKLGLICPNCGGTENIETYHKKYRCPDCGAEFEEPNIAFRCGSCGSLYDEQTMEIKPFKRIESSREMLAEYEKVSSAINKQIELLKQMGYDIERPASLVGESGVVHKFDAAAKRGDEIIAVVSSFGEPLTQVLVRLGVARSDLKLSRIILVTSDRPTTTEREFARSLGIEIVEAT